MLKIDKVTTIQARGEFTKICVELDLDKPLKPKVIARGYLLNLQCEGLHVICFNCGRYGHIIQSALRKLQGKLRSEEE